jgi:hypothetical protein
MKQGRFSNEQIVRILRETDQDSVAVVAEAGRSLPHRRDPWHVLWSQHYALRITRATPLFSLNPHVGNT